MRCKDCIWWKELVLRGHKKYNPVVGYQPNAGTCSHSKMVSGYNELLPSGGILTENDEGWGFITSIEFGCVNFTAEFF